MSAYVFAANGVTIELGDVGKDGLAVGGGGSAALDAPELPAATEARNRALAEAVASARDRMRPELAALAKARAVRAQAVAEHEAAGKDLERKKHEHRVALQRAENPTPTRMAVAAAEQRIQDATVWTTNAAVRLTDAERVATDAAGNAWRAEVASRRPAADAEKARLARAAAELFADLARLALAALPLDAVIAGPMPSEALVAEDEPEAQQPALRLNAG